MPCSPGFTCATCPVRCKGTWSSTTWPTHQQHRHQQRYILYNESLESDFPVCGEGYRDNPGTCEDDTGGGSNVQWGMMFPVAWLFALGGIAFGRRRP